MKLALFDDGDDEPVAMVDIDKDRLKFALDRPMESWELLIDLAMDWTDDEGADDNTK